MLLKLALLVAAVACAVASAQTMAPGATPTIQTYNFAGTWSNPFGGQGVSYVCQSSSGRLSAVFGGAAVIDAQVTNTKLVGWWTGGGSNTNTNWGALEMTIVENNMGNTATGVFWYGDRTTTMGGPFPISINRLSFVQPSSAQCWDTAASMVGAFEQQLAVPRSSQNKDAPTLAFCLDANSGVTFRGSAVNWYPNNDGSQVPVNWGFFGTSPDKGNTFQGTWKTAKGDQIWIGDAIARGIAANQVQLVWWSGSISDPSARVGAVTVWGPQSTATPAGDIASLCKKASSAKAVISFAVVALSAALIVVAL